MQIAQVSRHACPAEIVKIPVLLAILAVVAKSARSLTPCLQELFLVFAQKDIMLILRENVSELPRSHNVMMTMTVEALNSVTKAAVLTPAGSSTAAQMRSALLETILYSVNASPITLVTPSLLACPLHP